MRVVFPVRLENGMTINAGQEAFMISTDPEFDGVSGYDAHGDRVTHVVGFDGTDLLKRCTHPECREIKPSTSGFGEKGRNSHPAKSMRRDQAQCSECRSKRKK
jgi:hypothetical protein